MDMKENSQKKTLLSVLGVAILVVAVIGISFAAYSATFNSGNKNSVSTGTIMVSYTEPTSAINITDGMPLSDESGKALAGPGKTFDFSVSTKASNTLTVPYEVSLTKVQTSTLSDSEVKVYLTKEGNQALAPTLVDALADSTIRDGSKVLHASQDVFEGTGQEAKTTNYVLRMWIDKSVTVDNATTKNYKAKVNVDSVVTAIQ